MEINSSYNNIKIATTYKIYGCDIWDRSVSFISSVPKNFKLKNTILRKLGNLIDDFTLISMFFLARRKYDILLTNSVRAANLFAIFQGIFGKKIHHVMLNCLWRIPPNNLLKFLKKVYFKFISKGVDRFIVFSTSEIDDYHDIFNIPKSKMVFIPMYVTPFATKFNSEEGDYIFSAGHPDNRDFPTLLEAVKDLNIPVKIATQHREYFSRKKIPPHIEILSLSTKDFFGYMAKSKIVVVTIKKDNIRSAGQRTFLDAMYLRKPVIVADNKSVFNYISNGGDGIIVLPGDATSLRTAIKTLLDSGETRSQIASKAKEKAKNFTVDKTMSSVLDLLEAVVNEGK